MNDDNKLLKKRDDFEWKFIKIWIDLDQKQREYGYGLVFIYFRMINRHSSDKIIINIIKGVRYDK